MFKTEICECGKLKQTMRACKHCGFASPEQLAEDLQAAIAVKKTMPIEGDIERARR